jgi:hypothetical protein
MSEYEPCDVIYRAMDGWCAIVNGKKIGPYPYRPQALRAAVSERRGLNEEALAHSRTSSQNMERGTADRSPA